MRLGLSGIILLVLHLISVVFAPLFHQHSEMDHAPAVSSGYHSHAGPFTTHTSKHPHENSREDAASHHFNETSTPFADMGGIVLLNFENIINPAKSLYTLDLITRSSEASSFGPGNKKTVFDLPPPQPQQDYCVLTATNISPPQANLL